MSSTNEKSLRDRIIQGVEEGAMKALMHHKRDNRPIHVWKDGRVVAIPPVEIVVEIPGKTNQQ